MNLTLVVVGKDQKALGEFNCDNLSPAVKVVMLANTTNHSLAGIGNEYLTRESSGVVGLCHADCVFNAGALEAFCREAESGSVCGMVGRTDTQEYRSGYRWCFQNPGAVSTLDSCCVFLRADLKLWFDAGTFDGFHCHVEDLCLQAHSRNIPVTVPSAAANHIGVNWSQRREGHLWLADYQRYRKLLVKKWPNFSFATT